MKKDIVLFSLLTVLASVYLICLDAFHQIASNTFHSVPEFLFQVIFALVFGLLLLLTGRERLNTAFLVILIAINLIAAYLNFYQALLGISVYNLLLVGGALSQLIRRKEQPANQSSET